MVEDLESYFRNKMILDRWAYKIACGPIKFYKYRPHWPWPVLQKVKRVRNQYHNSQEVRCSTQILSNQNKV